jgi:hypothetical protein
LFYCYFFPLTEECYFRRLARTYLDDELYVSDLTQAARDYAGFQHLKIHEVGDTIEWLSAPPTKLVCVGDPKALDGVEARAKEIFAGRLYISKSLPYFLEFAQAGVTKSGLKTAEGGRREQRSFCRRAASSSFRGSRGVAVEDAHERVKAVARVCPPAADEA